MKKLIFTVIIVCSGICIAAACARSRVVPSVSARLYFVDAELNRLLPYEDVLPDADSEHKAQTAIKKLRNGRPDNEKIRQLIPRSSGKIAVTVKENVAYIDLDRNIADQLPRSRDIERLFVYQLVDTLTSIKGISYARFTIDGNVRKEFMGYLDMRETYKFTYPE